MTRKSTSSNSSTGGGPAKNVMGASSISTISAWSNSGYTSTGQIERRPDNGTQKKEANPPDRQDREFYDKLYERDGGHCIWCGVPIKYGVKYHHEPCGIYRSDEETKVVMLCPRCHFMRHHKTPAVARGICVDYLHFLYGEKGALKE